LRTRDGGPLPLLGPAPVEPLERRSLEESGNRRARVVDIELGRLAELGDTCDVATRVAFASIGVQRTKHAELSCESI
jgi:hypothetical protein